MSLKKPQLKQYPIVKDYNKAYRLWLKSTPTGVETLRQYRRTAWPKRKLTDSRRWLNLRRRARLGRGATLTLSITREQFVANLQKPCTYCGKLSSAEPAATTWCDRIDNTKGYHLDNILPCCPSCNQIRGVQLTVEEMRVAMKAVNALRARLAKGKP